MQIRLVPLLQQDHDVLKAQSRIAHDRISQEPFVPENHRPGLGADALRKSDYELFVQECLSEHSINGLGDLWADVA